VTPDPHEPLTGDTLAMTVRDLAARDLVLGGIVERFGSPPLWDRPAGFPTLVHIILEQQVSLASAAAAFNRLVARLDPLTPVGFLSLTDRELLAIGFSRQKARYARALARAVEDGTLDVEGLALLADEAVDGQLVAVPGIGPWTATIYRLMVLRRADAWPASDIALAQSLAEASGLPTRPSVDEMLTIADAWRPWRAVAARILWHGYLETRAARRGRPAAAAARSTAKPSGPE
jgi:DNA-3-methyladenine glycosylase II